jgi:Acetyltransferase (GNAT) domain
MIQIREITAGQFHLLREHFVDQIFRDPLIDRVYNDLLKYFGIFTELQMIGGFVAYSGGRGPLRTMITPPHYPHCGFFIQPDQVPAKQLLETIERFVKQQYLCYVKLDFPVGAFEIPKTGMWNTRWTYHLDLQENSNHFFQRLHPDLKNKIRRSQKEGLIFRPIDQKLDLENLIYQNLNNKKVRHKSALLHNMFRYLRDHPTCQYLGTYAGEQLVAGNIIYIDGTMAFHLFSAFDRTIQRPYANGAHLYQTIEYLRAQGKCSHFDFEGSTVTTIDQFFQKFGGDKKNYASCYYSRLPLLFGKEMP